MALSGSTTNTFIAVSIGTEFEYKLTFQWVVQSRSTISNSSTIKWTATLQYPGGGGSITAINSRYWKATIDGIEYTGKNGISYIGAGIKTLAEGTATILHNSGGERPFNYSFIQQWDVVGDSTPERSVSGSGVLDALSVQAAIITAPNFTDEESPMISYSNPTGDSAEKIEVGISLDSSLNDDIAFREVSKTGSAYTFVFTQAEKEVMWAKIPKNSDRITVNFLLRTTFGGKTYLTSKTATLTFVNYYPTLSPTAIDTNSRTTSLTGNPDVFIKYFSNAAFTTGAAARKGAYIDTQYVTCGDVTKNDEPTGTIEGVISNTYYFGVTDSRGNTTRDFLVKELIPYVKLTARLTTQPLTADGKLTFTVAGKYYDGSFGIEDNDLEVEYLVEDENGDPVFNTSGSGWVPLGVVEPEIGENNDYSYTYTITGLNHEATYTLTVNVIDKLMPQPTTVTKVIATVPIFDWGNTDFNFNVPVYLKDTNIPLEELGDYVIEQGTQGTWFYRKWYSGRAELYGYQNISNMACNTALGSMYRTVVVAAPSFPFTVYSPKTVTSYESDGYGAFIWHTTLTTNDNPPSYYLVRPTSSSGITGKVNFHIQGSWK